MLTALLLITLWLSAPAQQPPAAGDQPIRNFLKVSTDFCTGLTNAPDLEEFAKAYLAARNKAG